MIKHASLPAAQSMGFQSSAVRWRGFSLGEKYVLEELIRTMDDYQNCGTDLYESSYYELWLKGRWVFYPFAPEDKPAIMSLLKRRIIQRRRPPQRGAPADKLFRIPVGLDDLECCYRINQRQYIDTTVCRQVRRFTQGMRTSNEARNHSVMPVIDDGSRFCEDEDHSDVKKQIRRWSKLDHR